jgi:hypothetical protein
LVMLTKTVQRDTDVIERMGRAIIQFQAWEPEQHVGPSLCTRSSD